MCVILIVYVNVVNVVDVVEGVMIRYRVVVVFIDVRVEIGVVEYVFRRC